MHLAGLARGPPGIDRVGRRRRPRRRPNVLSENVTDRLVRHVTQEGGGAVGRCTGALFWCAKTEMGKRRESRVPDLEDRVLFTVRRGSPNSILNFMGRPEAEFPFYAGAFHEAAQALVQRVRTGEASSDLDACPIVFLYRHAMELYLKGVLLRGRRILRPG